MVSDTHVVNAIRVAEVDGAPMFAIQDIGTMFGYSARTLIAMVDESNRLRIPIGGFDFHSASMSKAMWCADVEAFRQIVCDELDATRSDGRRAWIRGWYSDTVERAYQFAGLDLHAPAPDVPVERRAEAPEPVPAPDVQAEPVTVNGTVRVGPFLVDLRKAVRRIVDRMSSPLDILEQAVTYIDGFRLGCRVGLGSEDRVRGLDGAFEDLAFAEDGFERAVSELEELANGGDAE